jgi:branched-chain amino acid transport system permease protein
MVTAVTMLPDPAILLQLLAFGLLLGGIYGLVALGLTLIFGVMDVINFAHGAMMVVAMYTVSPRWW